MKKILLVCLLSSCVTVKEETFETKINDRLACFNTFYAYLEDQSIRYNLFDVKLNQVQIPGSYLDKIVVLKDEEVVAVYPAKKSCKQYPKSCKKDEIYRISRAFPKPFATGYVFQSHEKSKVGLWSTMKKTSECLTRAGDSQSAKVLEIEFKKL